MEAGEEELPPPVVTRTRSGRRVRTPAALIDSEVVKAPTRRTRKTVPQEVAEDATELPTEPTPRVPTELPIEPAPCVPAVDKVIESHESTTVQCTAPSNKSEELMSDTCNEKENAAGVLESAPKPSHKTAKKRSHSESSEKKGVVIPLGKPKSGRVWKDRNKQRFSSLLRDKPVCTSWEKKMEAKREKELVKKFSLQLKEDKAKLKEDKRQRREENLKRREANERKAEVVQVIRNTTKIKRMKKKQLRRIEKRDTLAMLQKSQPKKPKASGEA